MYFLNKKVCNLFPNVIADLAEHKSTSNDFLFDPIYEIFEYKMSSVLECFFAGKRGARVIIVKRN